MRTARSYWAFAVVTALLVVAGLAYQSLYLDPSEDGKAHPPATLGSEWYVAVDEDGIAWDHYVHYVGYGSAIRHAREAEVLVIGSSRAQLGLDRDLLRGFASDQGLKLYNMSLGFGESVKFAEVLMERHNLRPRVLIVPVDTSPLAPTFSGKLSSMATKITDGGDWAALRYTYSGLWMKEIKRPIQTLFPYFLSPSRSGIVYRTWEDGFWSRPAPFQGGGKYDMVPGTDRRPPAVRNAEESESENFVKRMRARGALVVYAWIPATDSSRRRAEKLAKDVNVPLVGTEGVNFTGADIAHLDAESARRSTEDMLVQLRPIIAGLKPK